MKIDIRLILLIGSLLMLTLGLPALAQHEVTYPTTEWQTSSPEEQGMDSVMLLDALTFIEERQLAVDSITVIRHGKIVLDTYFYPYTPNTKHQAWSVTKSFVGTLVGIAIDQGLIKGIDQPLLALFPEITPAQMNENKQVMTVGNLLTMSSGLTCTDMGVGVEAEMHSSSNAVQYMLDLRMSRKPGSMFEYCNLNSDLLTAAVQKVAGVPLTDYADKVLFSPLGIKDYEWTTYQNSIPFGGFGLSITPHDMARLGYLYLQQGSWAGTQIVSSNWVDLARCADKTQCPFDDVFVSVGYGYHWWIFQPHFYTAVGANGQTIAVAPNHDIVVVITGSGITGAQNPSIYEDLIPNRILAAVKSQSSLPINEAAQTALAEHVSQLAKPESVAVQPLPENAEQLNGRIYDLRNSIYMNTLPPALAEHIYGRNIEVTAFTLSFTEEAEAQLDLYYADGYHLELPVGLDGVWRVVESDFGPLAAKGGWDKSGKQFSVQYQANTTAESAKFTFNIVSKGDVRVLWEDPAAVVGNRIQGTRADLHE
ncbi:MAG: serine hydrolase [Anaerolineae bacterium]